MHSVIYVVRCWLGWGPGETMNSQMKHWAKRWAGLGWGWAELGLISQTKRFGLAGLGLAGLGWAGLGWLDEWLVG